MCRNKLKTFIDEQFEQYGIYDCYRNRNVPLDDSSRLLEFVRDSILNKVEELYVQH
jgi:hypothetical protein